MVFHVTARISVPSKLMISLTIKRYALSRTAEELLKQAMSSASTAGMPKTIALADSVSSLLLDLAKGNVDVDGAKFRAAEILQQTDGDGRRAKLPSPPRERDHHRQESSSESYSESEAPARVPKRPRDRTGKNEGKGAKQKMKPELKSRSESPPRGKRSRSRDKRP